MTITEFLEARIAEDEAAAKAATPGPWEWEPETDGWGDCGPDLVTVAKLPPYPDGSQSPVETVIGSWGHDANGITVEPADAQHIARHDPARVLAECAAKRAIIELSVNWDGFTRNVDVLRALAAVYADHPDYQEAWAVG